MNYYIGAGGKLNLMLSEEKNLAIDKVYSARSFDAKDINVRDMGMLIWGGRNLPLESIVVLGNNNDCIYLSTYFYNDFLDSYQIKKAKDSKYLSENGWSIINIPFIKELLPDNVSAYIESNECKNSSFYILSTSVIDIAHAIANKKALELNRIGLKLSYGERICWSVFSRLYSCANRLPVKSLKYILPLVKTIEKVTLYVISTHKLSCVYIGGDK
jgi:hypothetical protein